MEVKATTTLSEIVQERLSTTGLFEEIGLDYYCGGNQSPEEACKQADRNVEEVLAAVGAALRVKPAGEDALDCRRLGLGDLVSHILKTHHVYTRRELGRLPRLLDKVCGVHGERHPELLEIRQLFESLKMDLEPHMRKKEQLLFPYVRALEQARHRGQSAPPSCFGTVRNSIGMMRTGMNRRGKFWRPCGRRPKTTRRRRMHVSVIARGMTP